MQRRSFLAEPDLGAEQVSSAYKTSTWIWLHQTSMSSQAETGFPLGGGKRGPKKIKIKNPPPRGRPTPKTANSNQSLVLVPLILNLNVMREIPRLNHSKSFPTLRQYRHNAFDNSENFWPTKHICSPCLSRSMLNFISQPFKTMTAILETIF